MPLPETRPASFREVEFGVLGFDTSGLGRRVQTHEYPKREQTYTEDLGAPPRVFSLDAFVRWENRARLIAVCGQPGAGTLVHPLFGSLKVICSGCEEKIQRSALGVAYFSLTFVLEGQNLFPVEQVVTTRPLEQAVDGAAAQNERSFAASYAEGDTPQWVENDVVGWIGSLSETIDQMVSRIPGSAGYAEFERTRDPLRAIGAQLLASPELLGATIGKTVRQLAQLAQAPVSMIRTLETLVRFGESLGTVTPSTRARAVQLSRQRALVTLVRTAGALEATRVAGSAPLDSYDAAAGLRARIDALLEPQAADAGERGDDALLMALETVRAESARNLRGRGAELARVRELTLDATLPAVVLANRLYGDPDRRDDIVARNPAIRHPLFVPAGFALEVLSA